MFRRRYWGGYHLPRHFHLFDTRALGYKSTLKTLRSGKGAFFGPLEQQIARPLSIGY